MRRIVYLFLLIPAFWLSVLHAVFAQDIENAKRILTQVDSLFNDPHAEPPPTFESDLNEGIRTFQQAGPQYAYQLGTLLFYRANYAELIGEFKQQYADLKAARDTLEHASNKDTLTLARLGNVWNGLNAYYTNTAFDDAAADEALQQTLYYFKKISNGGGLAETYGNQSFAAAKFGRCGDALYYAQLCKQQFDSLSPMEAAQTDDVAEYIPFINSAACMCLADSLSRAGRIAPARGQAWTAAVHLKQVRLSPKLEKDQWFSTYFAKTEAYYFADDPVALDSARRNNDRAIALACQNLPEMTARLALAQARRGSLLLKQGQVEAGFALVQKSLQTLGYDAADAFSPGRLREGEAQPFDLIRALLIKIQMLQLQAKEEYNPKYLAQIVHDAEMFGACVDLMRNDLNQRASFESISRRLSFIYADGAAAAGLLSLRESGQSATWRERAFRLAEQGKAFALRWKIMGANPQSTAAREDLERATLTLTQAQTLLPDAQSAAVEFSLSLSATTVFIITQKKVELFQLRPFTAWLDELDTINQFFKDNLEYYPRSQRFYETLMDSIVKALPTGINRLVIVPDAQLWTLNFDALVIHNDSIASRREFLLHRYATSYTASLQVLNEQVKISEALRPITGASLTTLGVFIGAETMGAPPLSKPLDCAITPFPEAQKAARRVAGEWREHFSDPDTVFYPATVQDFQQHLNDYDALLLVMHGCAEQKQNPLRYALLFGSDTANWLTVEKIYNLLHFERPRLICLISCDAAWSHLLQGEGLPSIARAFLYAGCPSLVAAGEKVPRGSAGLAITYLSDNLRQGLPLDVALQRAKLALLRKGGPLLNWAPLVCLGNGRIRLR